MHHDCGVDAYMQQNVAKLINFRERNGRNQKSLIMEAYNILPVTESHSGLPIDYRHIGQIDRIGIQSGRP